MQKGKKLKFTQMNSNSNKTVEQLVALQDSTILKISQFNSGLKPFEIKYISEQLEVINAENVKSVSK